MEEPSYHICPAKDGHVALLCFNDAAEALFRSELPTLEPLTGKTVHVLRVLEGGFARLVA